MSANKENIMGCNCPKLDIEKRWETIIAVCRLCYNVTVAPNVLQSSQKAWSQCSNIGDNSPVSQCSHPRSVTGMVDTCPISTSD